MSKREYRISRTIKARMQRDADDYCGCGELNADDVAASISKYLLVVASVALMLGMYIR